MKPTFAERNESLFRAARQDGPGSARKSRIWEGVALAPQLSLVASAGRSSLHPASAGAGAKSAAATAFAALSAGKLLLVGAALGSALTVGLGAFLLRGPLLRGPAHGPTSAAAPLTATVAAESYRSAQVDPGDPGVAQGYAPAIPATAPVRPDIELAQAPGVAARLVGGQTRELLGARPSVTAPVPHVVPASAPHANSLSEEIALVGDARKALAEGHGTAALAALDAAARGTSRSLEPEELSLRAHALRLLGRDAEADRVDGALKARYPGSFLAR